jgi:hypothetical protein
MHEMSAPGASGVPAARSSNLRDVPPKVGPRLVELAAVVGGVAASSAGVSSPSGASRHVLAAGAGSLVTCTFPGV